MFFAWRGTVVDWIDKSSAWSSTVTYLFLRRQFGFKAAFRHKQAYEVCAILLTMLYTSGFQVNVTEGVSEG